MSPRLVRALPLVVGLVVLAVVWVLRPGVILNGLQSPLAWAVTAGTFAAAVGVRALAIRFGARPLVAQGLSVALVVAVVATVLAPSFRQRTLVEELPAGLTAAAPAVDAPAADVPAGPPTVAGPSAPDAAPAQTESSTALQPVAAGTAPAAATPNRPRPATADAQPSRAATAPRSAQPAPTEPAPTRSEVNRSGRLEGINHTADGTVLLRTADGAAYVVFSDVNIEGTVEPSVHLVPAGRRTPGGGGIRLGALKAEKGTFSYRLPSTVDLSQQWSVLVWCDPYDTPIAAADPR